MHHTSPRQACDEKEAGDLALRPACDILDSVAVALLHGAGDRSEAHSQAEDSGAQAAESGSAAEAATRASEIADSAGAGAGANVPEAWASASEGRASASELADCSNAENEPGVDADTSAAASSQPQGAGATASAGARADASADGGDFLVDEMEPSVHGVEQQLQQLSLQKPGEACCCCVAHRAQAPALTHLGRQELPCMDPDCDELENINSTIVFWLKLIDAFASSICA